MRVLITGGNGYLGRHLAERLAGDRPVRASVRTAEAAALVPPGVEVVRTGDIGPDTDWTAALADIDAVVHAAGRVHRAQGGAADRESHRLTNTAGTENLAAQAVRQGVRHLVFISSIAVNGRGSGDDELTEASPPRPVGPYAVSKWEAERALRRVAESASFATTVLRPPLVYGPGAPGNFWRLVRWIERGRPVPVVGGDNERSMIFIGNLVDAIETALERRPPGFHTLLVADAERVSTRELARRIGEQIGRPARCVPVPGALLGLAGTLTGRGRDVSALAGPLRISIDGIRRLLEWRPSVGLQEGLVATLRRS